MSLLAPGSEWRLHRDWFEQSAMADRLGGDFGLAGIHKLYECLDLSGIRFRFGFTNPSCPRLGAAGRDAQCFPPSGNRFGRAAESTGHFFVRHPSQ